MTNLELFTIISKDCSRNTTKKYSTSFSSAINLLHKDFHQPIYDIYGFVRLADEIVDTFHDFNKQALLNDFKAQTYSAINAGFSLNPLLQAFQHTVNCYKIDKDLIDAFLYSMELDLLKQQYTQTEYEKYIYGSAEVVGLMCLQVFCFGHKQQYLQLKPTAKKLGAAFQKVNFLRDIKADSEGLGRMYFPNCDFNNFTKKDKLAIENDIQKDFDDALIGILQLPNKAKFGVYVAYCYYLALFNKIKKLNAVNLLQNRIRISNFYKGIIVSKAWLKIKV